MFLAETELITGGVSMYPTLETIRQLARTKEYRRIPLCRELYADRYTPVEVMRILRKASRHCYLLESASQTEVWGRYSFLGYEPSMEITCTDGTLIPKAYILPKYCFLQKERLSLVLPVQILQPDYPL